MAPGLRDHDLPTDPPDDSGDLPTQVEVEDDLAVHDPEEHEVPAVREVRAQRLLVALRSPTLEQSVQ